MPSKTMHGFDVEAFLNSAGPGKTILTYPPAGVIFSEGDAGQSVMYVQEGLLKLSVSSSARRTAIVGILGVGDFLGEACLEGHPTRVSTATAIISSTVLVIEKDLMVGELRQHRALSDRFTSHLLARTNQLEEDVANHILNHAETRLARVLWRLGHASGPGSLNGISSMIVQETLAQIVGTTRPRISGFMNKFKNAGLITYNSGITINPSLQGVIEPRVNDARPETGPPVTTEDPVWSGRVDLNH